MDFYFSVTPPFGARLLALLSAPMCAVEIHDYARHEIGALYYEQSGLLDGL
jgi:hypothetical protein